MLSTIKILEKRVIHRVMHIIHSLFFQKMWRNSKTSKVPAERRKSRSFRLPTALRKNDRLLWMIFCQPNGNSEQRPFGNLGKRLKKNLRRKKGFRKRHRICMSWKENCLSIPRQTGWTNWFPKAETVKGVVSMRYNIIGKNIDVWDKTKEMVEKKMDRIERLFPDDTNATITLSLEKLVSTVEVTIPLNKRLIRAEVQDADMTAAMDKAVDILENQVVRYKKRMRTKVRQGGDSFMAEYQAIMVPEETLDEEPLYKIERVKHFEVKPMDAEEAVMEMELIGHNFFVFRNGETDEVNVVYKRKNGSYGLIEPEY